MVIIQPFSGSVKDYIDAFPSQGCPFPVPARCPHPDCQASGSLIRWGTYQRGALTGETDERLRIQRVRCKTCGRTHSLLPDLLHPYRHFVISLLRHVVYLYLLAGLGWRKLTRQVRAVYAQGPALSTLQEWVASFAYGAGHLLLDTLLRHLLSLEPGSDLPDPPPQHLKRVPHPGQQRHLARAHTFWLAAEQVYVLVKQRQPDLHFSAAQFFPFLLHWLRSQRLPPRLFWSPLLATTPTQPF